MPAVLSPPQSGHLSSLARLGPGTRGNWNQCCRDWELLGNPPAPRALTIEVRSQGNVLVSRSRCSGALNIRNRGSERREQAPFHINLVSRTVWIERASGPSIEIDANGFAIVDTAAPLLVSARQHPSGHCTTLIVDRATLLRHFPDAEERCAQPLKLPHAVLESARGTLQAIWASAHADVPGATADLLVQALFVVLARLGGPEAGGGGVAPPATAPLLRARIHESIERNFQIHGFNVAELARELRVSTRHLQRICATLDTSPNELLRRHRLHAAAGRLREPDKEGRSITDVAYACGFGSSSHFATEFRALFGMSPREFRTAAT